MRILAALTIFLLYFFFIFFGIPVKIYSVLKEGIRPSRKKILLAKKAIQIARSSNIFEANQPFYATLIEISEGKTTPFDEGMEWYVSHELHSYRELRETLRDLSAEDCWCRTFKWLPWI